ncbi:hypothetical protein J5Y09_05265 [Roseomonas sp. PWR1]|uniref:Uracil-DNA glycosylase-like domain-containing protein n=1 Tax=Roseomonas nitratireducens TaxID=2820810 RepID=A0ABS4APM1_9PROT|nr:hypothetical protein [Neoroseomonas nitratireducens]MBP0463311.1 hypothetical protein [Neoroseomonas nitratireducens]
MRVPPPHSAVRAALAPAYAPCRHFGACPQAVWRPETGHIPRGFLGAAGTLDEVELIIVSAEPGHPSLHRGDMDFSSLRGPEELLIGAAQVSWNRRTVPGHADTFHKNFNWLLDRLWPGAAFADCMRRLWMTNARLCSVEAEIGPPPRTPCAETYLAAQISLFPRAIVAAFGGKARRNLERLGIPHIGAFALAPPGCNQRAARPSWERVIAGVIERRSAQPAP